MFELALRVWTGKEMVYPTKFSVMYDPDTRNSSVRIFVKNDKFIVFDYMFITPFKAINGPIFEQDIILINDNDDFNIVEFDRKLGVFVAKSIKTEDITVMNSELKYEIVGNIFEDKYLLNEEEPIEDDNVSELKDVDDEKLNNDCNNENKHSSIEEKNEEISVKEEFLEKEDVSDKKESLEKEDVFNKEEYSNKKDDYLEENKNIEECIDKQEDSLNDVSLEDNKSDEKEVSETDDLKEEIIESDYIETEEDNLLVNKSDKELSIDIHFISDCDDKGNGKYCFTFDIDGKKDTYKGQEEKTNSKRVDLSGIIAALEMLDGNFKVNIYTKSQYVVYPFEKGWIYKWSDSNWYKKENEKIQNYESWEILLNYVKKYNVKFKIVEKNTEDMEECYNIIKSI